MARSRSTRLAFALVVLIVGLAGVGLALYLAFQTVSTSARLQEEAPEVIERLETVAVAVQGHGRTAAAALQVTRDRLGSIDDVIDELSRNAEERKVQAVLEVVDTEITERLRNVEGFVRLLQTNLQSLSGTILLLESLLLIRPRQSAKAPDSDLKKMAVSLTEVSEALELVSATLIDIQSRQVLSSSQLDVLRRSMSRIDRHLGQAQKDVEDLSSQLEQLASQLGRARRQSRPWISAASRMILLFSLCFAFSQGALSWQGWRAFRSGGVRE